jgi:predicted NAD-dependent protein-ADP-ribosyltransferase YbiA (DUF1768 family)
MTTNKPRIIEIVNHGPYADLSNFCANSCFDMDPFKTVLHGHYYFMARLAGCADSVKTAVLRCKSPHEIIGVLGPEVYKYCSSIPHFNVRYNYDTIYANVMGMLALKLANNRRCIRLLLSTGIAELHMMNGTDNVLGMGRTGRRGLNMSGVALMELRHAYTMIVLNEKTIKPLPPVLDFDILDEFPCTFDALTVNDGLEAYLEDSPNMIIEDVVFRMTPLSCMGGASPSTDDAQTQHQSTPVHPGEP